MGTPIVREFTTDKTILKYFDHKSFAYVVPASAGTTDSVTGQKIVKAGTPLPANDATCVGILLYDVDVTQGDAPGALVYEGSIDTAKLTANGITVADTAKGVLPRVTFF